MEYFTNALSESDSRSPQSFKNVAMSYIIIKFNLVDSAVGG